MISAEPSDPLLGGRVQVYTGDGKGKTTAALGLAVRSACAGHRVYIGQFMKGSDYSELCLPSRFPELITLVQYGTPNLICQGRSPSKEDIAGALNGLALLTAAVSSGGYRLVIADELCVTIHMGLLTEDHGLQVIRARAAGVELVLTGRRATRAIMDAADLVTEMVERKHYYTTERLSARRGIEY